MFFHFFPLPFSVNSAPSALASVKNKISLTMRSPHCLASQPPVFLTTVSRNSFPLGVTLAPPAPVPQDISDCLSFDLERLTGGFTQDKWKLQEMLGP